MGICLVCLVVHSMDKNICLQYYYDEINCYTMTKPKCLQQASVVILLYNDKAQVFSTGMCSNLITMQMHLNLIKV